MNIEAGNVGPRVGLSLEACFEHSTDKGLSWDVLVLE